MYWKIVKFIIGLAIATLGTFMVFGLFGAWILAGLALLLIPFEIFISGIGDVVLNSEWTLRILFAMAYFPVLKFVLEDLMDLEIPKFKIFRRKQDK